MIKVGGIEIDFVGEAKKLEDVFEAVIGGVDRLDKGSQKLDDGLKKVDKTVDKFQTMLDGMSKGLGKVIGLTGALTAAFALDVREAEKNAEAVARLRAAVEGSGEAWDNWSGKLENVIKNLTMTTQYTRGDLTSALTRLIAITGDVTASSQMMGATMGLAAKTTMPLESNVRLLSQVMAGNVTMLGMYIPEFKRTTDIMQRFPDPVKRAAYALSELSKIKAPPPEGWQLVSKYASEMRLSIGKGLIPVLEPLWKITMLVSLGMEHLANTAFGRFILQGGFVLASMVALTLSFTMLVSKAYGAVTAIGLVGTTSTVAAGGVTALSVAVTRLVARFLIWLAIWDVVVMLAVKGAEAFAKAQHALGAFGWDDAALARAMKIDEWVNRNLRAFPWLGRAIEYASNKLMGQGKAADGSGKTMSDYEEILKKTKLAEDEAAGAADSYGAALKRVEDAAREVARLQALIEAQRPQVSDVGTAQAPVKPGDEHAYDKLLTKQREEAEEKLRLAELDRQNMYFLRTGLSQYDQLTARVNATAKALADYNTIKEKEGATEGQRAAARKTWIDAQRVEDDLIKEMSDLSGRAIQEYTKLEAATNAVAEAQRFEAAVNADAHASELARLSAHAATLDAMENEGNIIRDLAVLRTRQTSQLTEVEQAYRKAGEASDFAAKVMNDSAASAEAVASAMAAAKEATVAYEVAMERARLLSGSGLSKTTELQEKWLKIVDLREQLKRAAEFVGPQTEEGIRAVSDVTVELAAAESDYNQSLRLGIGTMGEYKSAVDETRVARDRLTAAEELAPGPERDVMVAEAKRMLADAIRNEGVVLEHVNFLNETGLKTEGELAGAIKDVGEAREQYYKALLLYGPKDERTLELQSDMVEKLQAEAAVRQRLLLLQQAEAMGIPLPAVTPSEDIMSEQIGVGWADMMGLGMDKAAEMAEAIRSSFNDITAIAINAWNRIRDANRQVADGILRAWHGEKVKLGAIFEAMGDEFLKQFIARVMAELEKLLLWLAVKFAIVLGLKAATRGMAPAGEIASWVGRTAQSGARVTKPTTVLAGEKGAEWIIPEAKMAEWVGAFMEGMMGSLPRVDVASVADGVVSSPRENQRPIVEIYEATEQTWVRVTDKHIEPRIRQRAKMRTEAG